MRNIEFSQVTTRGGDGGETSLAGGERRRKDDPIFDVLGDLDELCSFLGVAKAADPGGTLFRRLEPIQRMLFRIGALTAAPPSNPVFATLKPVEEGDIEALEEEEKKLLREAKIEPVFILPGGGLPSAHLDVARTVCRRAERRMVALIRERGFTELAFCQRYLNRLSDYLFVLARWTEQHL